MNNDLVIIKLDKEYELRMNNKTVKKLEKINGKNIQKIAAEVQDFTTEKMENLLYECLVQGEIALTKEAFIELLDEHCSYGEMTMIIMELFSNTFGREDEVKARIEKIQGKKVDPNV